jgi:DNA segregation ATPase FtsK/SpoIIIE, S-DNA-T family
MQIRDLKGTCSVAKKQAKTKLKTAKTVSKGQFIKYEAFGLVVLTLSLLGLADLGWVGQMVDYVCMFLAGDWHFLLPIYWMYLALLIMIRRAPVKWNVQQTGVLFFLIIILTWSHLHLYTALLTEYPNKKFDLFQITMDHIHKLYLSVRSIVDQNQLATPVVAGGGLIGFVCFSTTHFLFDTEGTTLVLFTSLLISIIMVTQRSLVNGMKKVNSVFYQRIKNGWMQIRLRSSRIRFKRDSVSEQPEIKVFDMHSDAGNEEADPAKPRRKALAKRKDADPMNEDTQQTETDTLGQEDLSIEINDFAERLRDTEPMQAETQEMHTGDRTGTANEAEYHSDYENARITIRWPERGQTRHEDGQTKSENASETLMMHPDLGEQPYELPSLQLLSLPKGNRGTYDQKDLTANAQKLKQTLESFGVQVHVNGIHRGPTVTRYEIQPAVGVKVARVVSLADDLALALAARDIRIEAPIPGKAAIGIEVPNKEVAVVSLREVLESSAFQQAESKLTIGLGRDISGEPIIGNLAKMPHLLVAGATGSGKSVCINGIITSLLFRAKPHEVKFIMIDPKMVELNVYNGIPHLMAPVVTDPRKAAYALKKVVAEMESRYELFAKKGTRDIERYNTLAKENGDVPLPYIVVIIDELADLMMVAPGDVEDAICRIAQMARAAGIHLIVATQRPSVDVITGVIKANIPSRIAFAVSSQADSRTILDGAGAEKLLGRGDMLYLPAGASKPIRIQGAYLSDQEVEDVVQYVKKQQSPTYSVDLSLPKEDVSTAKEDVDELFYDAVRLVVESQQASVSMLQRRFKIGYARAARLIDQMEERGIVGPFEGSKPREVRISKEQLQQIEHAG